MTRPPVGRADVPAWIVLAEITALLLQTLANLPAFRPDLGLGGPLLGCAVLLGTEAVHVLPPLRRVRDRSWRWTLSAQVALAVGGVLGWGVGWGPVVIVALASAVLLVPHRVSVPLAVATAVALAWLDRGGGVGTVLYDVVGTCFFVSSIWALGRLGEVAGELRASRDEVARLAVTDERDRFTRDLDLLLSRRIAGIAARAETAARLLPVDPAGAETLTAEFVQLSRDALSDVRAVAHGERVLSVAGQLRTAGALLTSTGVVVQLDVGPVLLPPAADRVLADLVREVVTTLVQDRSVGTCRMTLQVADGLARLEIGSDAVDPAGTATLAGLLPRVHAVGGTLQAHGGHALVATVPLAVAPVVHHLS